MAEILWEEKIGECMRGYICYTYTARRQEVSYGFLFPGTRFPGIPLFASSEKKWEGSPVI